MGAHLTWMHQHYLFGTCLDTPCLQGAGLGANGLKEAVPRQCRSGKNPSQGKDAAFETP